MANLIAEIGINHNGSLVEAKKLIDISSSTNCWGIKFQYRNLKNYFKYKTVNSELGKEIIDKEIKKNYLDHKQICKLAEYARKKNLKVGLSLFSINDFNYFKNYEFDFLKIPSPVCHDYALINFLKKKSKIIVVSFGGKNFFEIKKIINDCKLKYRNTVLMHCISNYPVNELNSNLGFLDTLRSNYKNFKIGYSSHESTILNSILCLSKGVDFIERHITLDKYQNGLDHSSSSDHNELKLFQKYNENFQRIFEEGSKLGPNQGEILNIQNLGVSYYANRNFKTGEKIKLSHLKKNHPCVGLTDLNIKKYLKKKLIKNIKKNEPITESLFFQYNLNKQNLKKLISGKFSIPIRPSDYKKIYNQIPIKNFEMHLSLNDLRNFNLKNFNISFLKQNNFTIHMPDYCDENNIIDFFSSVSSIKTKSMNLLNRAINIAENLKKINGKNTKIIVSLSKVNNKINKYSYYKKVKKLCEILKIKSVNLLPQWLPVDAWYFGGNVKTMAFSNPKDLNFLKKINLDICLDTSHFILSCNFYKLSIMKYFKENKKIFKHIHLSDAKGIDGEGVLIGTGDLLKSRLLNEILNDHKNVKVLETWQGHINNLYNFKKDIITLTKFLK